MFKSYISNLFKKSKSVIIRKEEKEKLLTENEIKDVLRRLETINIDKEKIRIIKNSGYNNTDDSLLYLINTYDKMGKTLSTEERLFNYHLGLGRLARYKKNNFTVRLVAIESKNRYVIDIWHSSIESMYNRYTFHYYDLEHVYYILEGDYLDLYSIVCHLKESEMMKKVNEIRNRS